MENQQNIQYKQDNNQGTIYNAPVYITYAAPQPIAPEQQVSTAEPKNEPNTNLFCRITKAAYEAGKAPIVEEELRSACVSAPKLIKTIRTNEALGYLDTQNLSSKELYELLDEHFGLTFKQRNFSKYRSAF